MRILMLAQFYPPDLGGEERHVHNLAHALSALGHHVEVVTTEIPSAPPGRSLEGEVVVHRVHTTAQSIPYLQRDPARPHALPIADPAMERAITALCGTEHFDVVHAHNWIVNSALGPTRHFGIPLVQTLHDYSHVCAMKRLVHNGSLCEGPAPIRCLACSARHYGAGIGLPTVGLNAWERRRREQAVSAFIAVSRAVAHRTYLADRGVDFEVIPNFIPDELLEGSAEPSPNGPIVFAGDLSADKGVPVLLQAYEQLRTSIPLQLIGRPTVELRLPSGANLLGPLPHEAVIAHMRAARAVVVPSSIADPCPTVVLEGMALGRPVVAAASGGIVDMIEHGVSGLLADPGDPVSLAARIRNVLENQELAGALGSRARIAVRAFTASEIVGRIEDCYRRVITKPSRLVDHRRVTLRSDLG